MEMNWKNYPHLFCNGRFQALSNNYRFTITGISDYHHPNYATPQGQSHRIFHVNDMAVETIDVETCTLIARKVDSMSQDEEKKFDELQEEMNLGNWYFAHPECFLFLLSKGIYPFSQSHFGETVIDIKTIEK